MARVKSTVALRNPSTGAVTVLVEGVNAPAWAESLSGNDDVLAQRPAASESNAESEGAEDGKRTRSKRGGTAK